MKKLILVGWMCLVVALMPSLVSAQVKAGQAAPDFKLTDSNGQTHSLADFKGKYVVLEWLNHDCPFVKKHYDGGNMQSLQKKYAEKGVVWLSIISSAPGKQGHYAPDKINAMTKKKEAAPTAVLIDEDGKVGKAYGAKTTPEMFVINPEGQIIYAGAIDSIKSTDADDVAKATNYVASALEEAMAGKSVTTAQTKSYGCSVKY